MALRSYLYTEIINRTEFSTMALVLTENFKIIPSKYLKAIKSFLINYRWLLRRAEIEKDRQTCLLRWMTCWHPVNPDGSLPYRHSSCHPLSSPVSQLLKSCISLLQSQVLAWPSPDQTWNYEHFSQQFFLMIHSYWETIKVTCLIV